MTLDYKCLILDHDDTVVDSTPVIHYPAHLEAMKVLRPDHAPVSLNGWLKKNFHPGIMAYLTEELKMSETEMELEYRIWRQFTETIVPPFFAGMRELLLRFKESGGVIGVVSHSDKDVIENHYRADGKGGTLCPDMVFGWDTDENKRKPSPFPVEQILKKFRLDAAEALIVDDLKPGVLMSRATGVPIVAAGWGHRIPEIRDFMEKNCLAYLERVEALADFLFS